MVPFTYLSTAVPSILDSKVSQMRPEKYVTSCKVFDLMDQEHWLRCRVTYFLAKWNNIHQPGSPWNKGSPFPLLNHHLGACSVVWGRELIWSHLFWFGWKFPSDFWEPSHPNFQIRMDRARNKNNGRRILSMKYWLGYRDRYNGLLYSLYQPIYIYIDE